MTRRPPKPVPLPGAGPRQHMDAGAPRPADRDVGIRVVLLDPPREDPVTVEHVLDVLERILRGPERG